MIFSHGGSNALTWIALLGWPFVVFAMFGLLGPRRAALWSLVIGSAFLPEGAFLFAGLPEYTKQSATGVSVLLASILLDAGRPLRVRFRWVDLAIVAWCVGRFATSLSNGLGAYDGLSQTFIELVRWGIPYWVGRTYFSDDDGLRELARGIAIGGLLYMPLCLFEVRFSPQLHTKIYGFLTTPFYMVLRYDGYRPMVFMQTSLMVAMWMASATVLCAWLGYSGAVKKLFGLPTKWFVIPLAITTMLCKAFGAITLMLVGISFYFIARRARSALPVAAFALLVGSYPMLRYTGVMSQNGILSAASVAYDAERLDSLGIRLRSEDMFIGHASDRPLLGWGGWGRSNVYVEGVGRAVPDGLWVIALASAGWLALASLMAMFLTPTVQVLRRFRAARWARPDTAPYVAMAVLVLIYWVDCLSNAMVNAVLVAAIAGTNGWFAARQRKPATTPTLPDAPSEGTVQSPETTGPPLSLGRALSSRRRGPPA